MNLYEEIKNYIPCNIQEENDQRLILKYFQVFPNLLSRDNQLCHLTASSWVVNKERTKVLMVYHNIYNSWSWTGGHADGNSDLLEVAKEEVLEETGVKELKLLSDGIYSMEILPVNAHMKNDKFVPSHLHLNCTYLFEASEEEELKIKKDENSAVSWIDIKKVNDVVTEDAMKVTYDKLNQKLEKYI